MVGFSCLWETILHKSSLCGCAEGALPKLKLFSVLPSTQLIMMWLNHIAYRASVQWLSIWWTRSVRRNLHGEKDLGIMSPIVLQGSLISFSFLHLHICIYKLFPGTRNCIWRLSYLIFRCILWVCKIVLLELDEYTTFKKCKFQTSKGCKNEQNF